MGYAQSYFFYLDHHLLLQWSIDWKNPKISTAIKQSVSDWLLQLFSYIMVRAF